MKKTILLMMVFIMLNHLNGHSQIGNYLNFDDTDDYMNCGDHFSSRITGTQITLEALVNFTSFHPEFWKGSIINKEEANGSGYMIRSGANGKINFNLGSNPGWNELTTDESVISTGTWHHVAATYDGITMKIYVDGVLKKSEDKTFQIANTTQDLYIGSCEIYPDRNADAKIDEVRIWSVVRTAEKIDANKSSELASDDRNGLVGYYKLNQTENDMIISGVYNETENIKGELKNFDKDAPTITSGGTATAINENSGANQVIYTVTATDNVAVKSFGIGGQDSSDFTINNTTGDVTLTMNPDFATKSSYSFDVTATDWEENVSSAVTVSLSINQTFNVIENNLRDIKNIYVSNTILHIEGALKEKTQMYVYNILGKLVVHTVLAENNNSSSSFNLPQLPTGMYFLKLTNRQGLFSKKIIIN